MHEPKKIQFLVPLFSTKVLSLESRSFEIALTKKGAKAMIKTRAKNKPS